jgi:3-methyladenine DNA glycosylase Tag
VEHFDRIYERAVARKGEAALRESLPKPRTQLGLKRLRAATYLSEMSRAVFRSGFVWRIVDYKWPDMEQVLYGFDPVACAFQPDEAMEALLADTRVIRHLRKLRSVRDNAAFVIAVEREYQSFGRYIADWPVADIVGLHADLKRRGSRLGGRTGQFFLRRVGKDTFCLTRDVVGALVRQGVVDKTPVAKRDLAAVQAAFNDWREQSGRPLCEISRILSCSIEG